MKYTYIAAIGTIVSLVAANGAFAQGTPAVPAKPAPAKTAPAPQQFFFKDLGGIKSWRPTGDHELYVKDGNGQWYRVHMYEPCMKLFPGKNPTFVTQRDIETGQRSNAVMIERRKCQVTSVTKGEPPAPKEEPGGQSPMQ